mgnify:CR=1 FL=1
MVVLRQEERELGQSEHGERPTILLVDVHRPRQSQEVAEQLPYCRVRCHLDARCGGREIRIDDRVRPHGHEDLRGTRTRLVDASATIEHGRVGAEHQLLVGEDAVVIELTRHVAGTGQQGHEQRENDQQSKQRTLHGFSPSVEWLSTLISGVRFFSSQKLGINKDLKFRKTIS